MNGAWPPSSRLSRFTWSAAPRISCLPTSVEPVKLILRHDRVLEERVGDLLGRADDQVGDARRQAGVDQALEHLDQAQRRLAGGLADDGAAGGQGRGDLAACSVTGKFHGLIAPTTPTGCLMRHVPLARRPSWE